MRLKLTQVTHTSGIGLNKYCNPGRLAPEPFTNYPEKLREGAGLVWGIGEGSSHWPTSRRTRMPCPLALV